MTPRTDRPSAVSTTSFPGSEIFFGKISFVNEHRPKRGGGVLFCPRIPARPITIPYFSSAQKAVTKYPKKGYGLRVDLDRLAKQENPVAVMPEWHSSGASLLGRRVDHRQSV